MHRTSHPESKKTGTQIFTWRWEGKKWDPPDEVNKKVRILTKIKHKAPNYVKTRARQKHYPSVEWMEVLKVRTPTRDTPELAFNKK